MGIASTSPALLLDNYPLLRSTSLDEASERIGRVFSPHRLALSDRAGRLDVVHNQVRLRDVSLNVLRYGAEVSIDPGERGDFYMVQLPLSGQARLACGGQEVCSDREVLSVLQPQSHSRMVWSSDCAMILIQVPSALVQARARAWGQGPAPRIALAHSRREAEVGAWWQAVTDLTLNLDRFGPQWLRHPAACAGMEEFLLSAFTALLCEQPEAASPVDRGDARVLRRAKDYIHAHLDRALSAQEIANHACVSPRTLEMVFKRQGEASPLAYARASRLEAVHALLRQAAQEGRRVSVTEVALGHGFLHMGRFAAQYREKFGCSPSASHLH